MAGPTSAPGEVYLVLLEYGRAHERAALDLLTSTLRRVFPAASQRTVVVDNAPDGGQTEGNDGGFDRVIGDNARREFSGWDRGVDWLERRYAPGPDSIVVLANDTVVRAGKRERVRDIPATRAAEASGGAIVGWVEEYPRPVDVFGLAMRQWVDTSCVLTAQRTLAALRPLARPIPDGMVFADDWRVVFREPSPLSDNYRAYLKTYFFGEHLDQDFTHEWYARAPVTEGNFDAFKMKLQCVFCEHLLSARALERGIRLVDIRPTARPIDPPGAPARGVSRASA